MSFDDSANVQIASIIGSECFALLEKDAFSQGISCSDVLREAVLLYLGQLPRHRFNALIERAEAECLRQELLGDIAHADKDTLATLRAFRTVKQPKPRGKGD